MDLKSAAVSGNACTESTASSARLPHHQLQQRHAEDVRAPGQPPHRAHRRQQPGHRTRASSPSASAPAATTSPRPGTSPTRAPRPSTTAPNSTVKLKLVAKDPAILKNLTSVLIWIDPARGISLKQQFFTPAGDSKTTYFTNIRYNQKIDKAETASFAIKTNKHTQIDRH